MLRRLFHASRLSLPPRRVRLPFPSLFQIGRVVRHPLFSIVLLYLAFLVWQAPPSILFDTLRAQTALTPLRPLHPEGTLWRGHAAALELPGHTLANPTWELSLLSVLGRMPHGQFSTGTEGSLPFARGSLTLNLWSDTFRLQELSAHLPLSLLSMALKLPDSFALGGELRTPHLEATFQERRPELLQGEVTLLNLHLVSEPEKRFGTFVLRFHTDTSGVHATMRDQGGPVRLSVQWDLKPDGSHALQGEVNNSDPNLQRTINVLKYIGRTDASGTTHFQWSGKMP